LTKPVEIGAQGIGSEVLFPQAGGEKMDLKGGMGIDALKNESVKNSER
jgi:hypothetical protein